MTVRYIFIMGLLLFVNFCNGSPGRRSSVNKPKVTATWLGDYCTKDSDCNFGECCVYRPDRYSIPGCRRLENEKNNCIPTASTLNTTLFYPDGTQLELFDVHRILCPCGENLRCDNDGICTFNNIIEGSVDLDKIINN